MALMLMVLVVWLIFASAILAAIYREPLRRFWCEPALKRPVLIFESDDWGAGPHEQAARLQQIADRLAAYRDHEGNPPVMTLGVVLAIADGAKIAAGDFAEYRAIDLAAPEFQELIQAMQTGVTRGVFTLQLHGMEHYWPPTLFTMSRDVDAVRAWLQQSPESWTEDLPSPVQSRWCDAATLPSKPISSMAIQTAARAEVSRFATIFGTTPRVVVPPTFVWNEQVEQAWADAGVKYIVTPGRRYESRSAAGKPASGSGGQISNGCLASSGITYLVRDVYFEPALGHKPKMVAAQIGRAIQLGRPALLETHRFNFVRDEQAIAGSLDALTQSIEQALHDFPRILFLSTESLADKITAKDSALIEQRLGARLAIFLARLNTIPRLRKLALLSGLGIIAWSAYRFLNRIYFGKAA